MAFRIRPFQPSDGPALLDICCKTGNSGGDATGHLTDDTLWGNIFALPYAVRDPTLAFVVVQALAPPETDNESSGSTMGEQVVGYCVATADTLAFTDWYGNEYWPQYYAQYTSRQQPSNTLTPREKDLIAYASSIGHPDQSLNLDEADVRQRYPAHLHINLLPVAQGQGLGKRLLMTVVDQARAKGCPGIHLGTSLSNTASHQFYRKCGFEEQSPRGSTLTFVMDFAAESER